MYTLLQIVIYLQSVDSSSVTLLNHYDTQKECENIVNPIMSKLYGQSQSNMPHPTTTSDDSINEPNIDEVD